MNPISIVLFSLAIIVIAGAAAFITHQSYKKRLIDLQTRSDSLDIQLKEALSAKAAAEEKSSNIPKLERQIAELFCEKDELLRENSALKQQHESDAQNAQWGEKTRQQLEAAFESLSSKALKSNSEAYLNQARAQFQGIMDLVKGDWGTHKVELQKMVEPLEKTLQSLDQYSKEIETKREGAYSTLQEQLRELAATQGSLQLTTNTLVQALKHPGVRGRWGEGELRRIVEMAGLNSKVHFEEQVSGDLGRPDMIVHLPNKGLLPVDSKTPMDAYLDSINLNDEPSKKAKLSEHATVMRQRIRDLGKKSYWEQFSDAAEIVIMFIPSDACIGAAFEQDSELFAFALQNKVVITSPFTLFALLKAVAYGWQQQQVTENAKKIADESKILHDRLGTFISHLGNIGSGLNKAVESFNKSVNSFNSRVIPVSKRISILGISEKELEPLNLIETMPLMGESTTEDKRDSDS